MKATATVLGNNILLRGRREKIPITPMKLQKLLYFICVKYVKDAGDYPLSEPFEVWQYGPVLPSVYYEFKPFGASPITQLAKDSKGGAQMVDEAANPTLTDCVNYVWSRYKNFTGIELSRITHQPGCGWYSAFQENREIIEMEEMRDDTTI